MRIYTKRGDNGETALVGGTRVPKDSPWIGALGTVDELNSALGAARAWTSDSQIRNMLEQIQQVLLDICGDIATPSDHPKKMQRAISPEQVKILEQWIDEVEAELPPWTHFILPGGTKNAALLHLARTICRRAERRVVSLTRVEPVNPAVLAYLNRLSDLLFVLPRLANHRAGETELTWDAPE